MPKLYKKEIGAVNDMYCNLCNLPIGLMKPALKTAKVISDGQKAKIDKMTDTDAAIFILDDVITSLKADVPNKLDAFVKVLIDFDEDATVTVLGKQLLGKLSPNSQARIQPTLSVDQSQGGQPPGGNPYQQPNNQQQPGYQPPQSGYTGYPPQQPTGYPPQQPTGYPPQQPTGYPPQQPTGYPPQQPGYTGYPPTTGYPPPTGYPPGNYPPMPALPADVIQVEKFLSNSRNLGTDPIAADDSKINAVCRIITSKIQGTGWVASLTLKDKPVTVLLTNNHILESLEVACSADTEYQFAYLYKDSEKNPAVIYGNELIPDNQREFHTCLGADERHNVLLDYTVVEVCDRPLIDTKVVSELDGLTRSIYDCRFDLDIVAEPAKTDPNNVAIPPEPEIITIHHHPNNEILKKSSQGSLSVDYLLFYWCNTNAGSSGAPVVKVVNEEPRVLALHRASWGEKGFTVNFGTLITHILAHVRGEKLSYVMDVDLINKRLSDTVRSMMK